MKRYPWRKLPTVLPLLVTALLFAVPPLSAQTRTEEWVETGRFGAEEPEDPAAAAEKGLATDWLYLGLRAGPSLRFYTPSNDTPYTGNDTLSVSLDVALQANLHLLSFLSLQTEAVFTWDNASLWAYTGTVAAYDYDRYTVDFTSFSFQFPFIVKLDFYPGKFRLSPFAGVYYLLPLGKLEVSASLGNDKETVSYKVSPSMGFLGGLSGAMKFGPGMLIADLRYAADQGDFEVDDTKIFRRSMISFTVGYELGFFTKKKGGRP